MATRFLLVLLALIALTMAIADWHYDHAAEFDGKDALSTAGRSSEHEANSAMMLDAVNSPPEPASPRQRVSDPDPVEDLEFRAVVEHTAERGKAADGRTSASLRPGPSRFAESPYDDNPENRAFSGYGSYDDDAQSEVEAMYEQMLEEFEADAAQPNRRQASGPGSID